MEEKYDAWLREVTDPKSTFSYLVQCLEKAGMNGLAQHMRKRLMAESEHCRQLHRVQCMFAEQLMTSCLLPCYAYSVAVLFTMTSCLLLCCAYTQLLC